MKKKNISHVYHRKKAYILLLLVALIWGVAQPVIKFTLTWFDPLVFLSYRLAISTVVALLYFLVARPKLSGKASGGASTLLYGLTSVTLALGFLFFGFDKTTSLTGSLLSATGPLMVISGGALLLHERVTGRERFGILLAFLGTMVTAFFPLLTNGTPTSVWAFEGNLLIVAATITDTASALIAKVAIRRKVDPTFLAHSSFVIGFLTLLPLTLLYYPVGTILSTITSAPIQAHVGVWFMALVSGTLAYTLRNIAVKSIEVSEAAVFSYLQPIFAAILAVLWLREPITLPYVMGFIAIAIGVYIAEQKRK